MVDLNTYVEFADRYAEVVGGRDEAGLQSDAKVFFCLIGDVEE